MIFNIQIIPDTEAYVLPDFTGITVHRRITVINSILWIVFNRPEDAHIIVGMFSRCDVTPGKN